MTDDDKKKTTGTAPTDADPYTGDDMDVKDDDLDLSFLEGNEDEQMDFEE